MKKNFMTLALALCLGSVFAQEVDVVVLEGETQRSVGTYTKRGQQILPQAGDVALTIDATPLLKYVGNSFNGSSNNDASDIFSFTDNIFDAPSISGKYFLSDNAAIRATLHLGFTSQTEKTLVDDVNSTTTPKAQVEDKITDKQNGLGLRLGYEMRRGYGRLQGFFGPEVGLGMFSESTTWDWGNDLGSKNPYSRSKKTSSGTELDVLVGGFAGVEYFVAPKIAVGGEASLSILFENTGKGKVESERWTGSAVETTTIESAGSSASALATHYGGRLFVSFYF